MPLAEDLPRPFGPYTLTRRIAAGGMAEVYVATTRGVGGFEKSVAIKVILPRYSEDEHFVRMLVEEAKISALLTHANIGQVYDLGCIEGTYFIVMEYIEGADAYRLLRRLKERGEEPSIESAVYIGHEICQGLDYAHRRRGPDGRPLRIVHRDVSPQNVLISFAGEVKLVDFGIAKAALRTQQTEAGVIKGKYYYMSPEQAWGDPLDHRSDIFSTGLVLHELLTGRMVHRAKRLAELLEMVRKAEIAPPSHVRPDVSPELDAIVMRSLARNPDDRWQRASEFAQALSAYLHRHSPGFGPGRIAQLMARAFDRRPGGDGVPEEPLTAQGPVQDTTSLRAGEASILFRDPDGREPTREVARRKPPPPAPQAKAASKDEDDTLAARPSAAVRALAAKPPPPSSRARSVPPPAPSAARVAAGDWSSDASTARGVRLSESEAKDPTAPAPSTYESGVRRGEGTARDGAMPRQESLVPFGSEEASPDEEPTAAIFVENRSWEDATLLDEEAQLRALREAMGEGALPPAPATPPVVPPTAPPQLGNLAAPPAEERARAAAMPTEKLGAVEHVSVPVLASARGRSAVAWTIAALGLAVLAGLLWWLWPSQPPELRISTRPAGASVHLDGRPVGTTPLTLRGEPLQADQDHTLELRAPGHVPRRRSVRLEPGELRTLRIELPPATVALRVETQPPGASVYVDGVFVGSAPVTVPDRTVGKRVDVRAVAPGHQPVTETVAVEGEHGGTQTVTLRLNPSAQPPEASKRPRRRRRGSHRRGGRRRR